MTLRAEAFSPASIKWPGFHCSQCMTHSVRDNSSRISQKMSETKKFQVLSPIPEKLYRLIDGFRLSKALFAACELEVFDKLRSASSPQSADDITKALSSDLDATTRLMDTLVAMELLEKFKQGDQWLYSNSEMATKFLTKDSPDSYLDMISMRNKTTYPIFGNLETAVLEGTTQFL